MSRTTSTVAVAVPVPSGPRQESRTAADRPPGATSVRDEVSWQSSQAQPNRSNNSRSATCPQASSAVLPR
jgi:hypothetical protein